MSAMPESPPPESPLPAGSPPGAPATDRTAPGSNAGLLIGLGLFFLAAVAVLVAFLASGDNDGDTQLAGDEGVEGSPDDDHSGTQSPTTPATTPEVPASASVGDCISVSSSGDFLGAGTCLAGGPSYKVVEVVEQSDLCADPEQPIVPDGDIRLCVELNLHQSYCYHIPEGAGWVEEASNCEVAGVAHVIDVVPGAVDDAGCTDVFEWNRYYVFSHPQMVACVNLH